MNTEQRLKVLEEEFKILKNEVKTILLDLREQYLNIQNPFNYNMNAAANMSLGSNPEDFKDPDEGKVEKPKEEKKPEPENKKQPEPVKEPEPEIPEPEPQEITMEETPGFAGRPLLYSMDDGGGLPGFGSTDADLPGSPGFGGFDEMPGPGQNPSMSADEDDDEDPIPKAVNDNKKSARGGKGKAFDFTAENGRFDLVVIAGLSQWIDQASAKLGKERAEALVEMACTMGRIPENLKDVLIKMARLSRYESNGQTATATDYLALLAQLENLLGESEIQDKALLSILSMMKGNNTNG
jgi:hypothetical protein